MAASLNTPPNQSLTTAGAPLADRSSLNLFLILGIVLLLISLIAFGSIAEDVAGSSTTAQTTNEILSFDYTVSNNIHASALPLLDRVMLVISLFGSQLLILAAIGLAILFIWRRRWLDLRLLLVAMIGEELFNVLFKLSFHRLRPAFADPLFSASGYSFPSGHAMASMVFYGLCAYLLIRSSHRWRDRVLIVVSAIALVVVIGYSRIYLGLHYPSDVLGGYSAGLGWLVFAISGMALFERWRLHRANRLSTASTTSSSGI